MKLILGLFKRYIVSIIALVLTSIFFFLIFNSETESGTLGSISGWLYFFAVITPIFAIALGYKRK